jgi:hypothetical protein
MKKTAAHRPAVLWLRQKVDRTTLHVETLTGAPPLGIREFVEKSA